MKAQDIEFLGERVPQSVDTEHKTVQFACGEPVQFDLLIAMPPNIPSPVRPMLGEYHTSFDGEGLICASLE